MSIARGVSADGLLAAAREAQLEGKLALTARLLDEALRLRPGDATLWNNLSATLLALGRHLDAATMARKAIALNANYALAHLNLGRALVAQDDEAGAEAALACAVELAPSMPELRIWHASLPERSGRWTSAAQRYEKALDMAPCEEAAVGLAAMHLKSGEPRAAVAVLRTAAKRFPPGAAALESHALFAMHFDVDATPDALLAAHRDWAARHVPADVARPARVRKAKIRIGYVAPALNDNALGFALFPVWRHHDRERFEVYAYSGAAEGDRLTKEFLDLADGWRNTALLDDKALAEAIRNDAIDVLVDLAGHTPAGRLGVFALRPAPVQVSWLDYFDTTGVAAIDAVIADEASRDEGIGQHFVERVVAVGPVRYPYLPPAYAPEPAPLPCTLGKPVTFASFARWSKATPAVREAWRAILAAVPGSRLLLKADAFSDPQMRARVVEEFTKGGIEAGRLELRPLGPHVQMFAELNDADIILDTFPYNGGITTLEALWMGRPVVTRRGETMIARQGASLLAAIGLGELVASDDAGYVERAVALARAPARLAALATGLRQRMAASALTDAASFTRGLETLYTNLLEELAP